MSPGATASGSNGDRSLAADCHGHLNRSAYRQLIYQLDVRSPILLVASRPGQLDHATIRLELLEARSRPTMRSQRSTGAARIKALRQGLFALLTGDRSPLDVHCPLAVYQICMQAVASSAIQSHLCTGQVRMGLKNSLQDLCLDRHRSNLGVRNGDWSPTYARPYRANGAKLLLLTVLDCLRLTC